MNEETIFQLILHGGNARGEAYEALDAAEEFDFEKAEQHLKEAEKEFSEAHKAQTEVIRSSGESGAEGNNLLLIHAQDHVMTAQAELNLIKRLIDSYRVIQKLEQRIERLENK
ncbi:PTS lactose/cellobiose transporter subunit IIA [Caenibacillus caldisaponilyticus]|jgi:PTS system cellobiose-specific IIA component|uniref:PTS lactose/cellobiose transporter subunit IIA n=1 Tax=Caenibacillus caldisaponilyticus TaxID=1674942 RepID=UPI000988777B|nr:PTS lactose/cellobiose transporter subunit IIA [Caenibacillus caldisaponilyticus]